MNTVPTNADRAAWAKHALATFTTQIYRGVHPESMNRDRLQSAISDLIVDLLHLAHQQGFDAGSLVQQAFGHFDFELFDDEGSI